MENESTWLDGLLEQVATGEMLPQEALQRFFLHKKEANEATLTDEDNAFMDAMSVVEAAQTVAKWCVRNASVQGGVTAIEADLRHPSFFRPRRNPPLLTGTSLLGKQILLFSPQDTSAGQEYTDDCLRVSGSFTCARGNPAFLPVFTSALTTALKAHGLPAPTFIR